MLCVLCVCRVSRLARRTAAFSVAACTRARSGGGNGRRRPFRELNTKAPFWGGGATARLCSPQDLDLDDGAEVRVPALQRHCGWLIGWMACTRRSGANAAAAAAASAAASHALRRLRAINKGPLRPASQQSQIQQTTVTLTRLEMSSVGPSRGQEATKNAAQLISRAVDFPNRVAII